MKRLNPMGLKTSLGFAFALAVTLGAASPAQAFSWEDLNPFAPSKYEMKFDPDVPADRYYNEGLTRLEKRDYDNAVKQFSALQKQYPFTQWARKALMMELYAQHLNGDATAAVSAADRYIQLYPNAPDLAYANYLAGVTLFDSLPDVHRDQGKVAKAMKYFETIVEKYPKSEYAADASHKILMARDQLAGTELNVGRFYLQRQNYTAAINRFREVLFKYQSTREAEEALERLTEAYLAMGIVDEAETAAAVLGANYPNSTWYKEAFDRLKTEGLAPQNHQDSWISKMFRNGTT